MWWFHFVYKNRVHNAVYKYRLNSWTHIRKFHETEDSSFHNQWYQQKGLDAHYLADESFCLHSFNDLTLNILSELDRTLISVGILLQLDAGI
jgi:hypothetical protein